MTCKNEFKHPAFTGTKGFTLATKKSRPIPVRAKSSIRISCRIGAYVFVKWLAAKKKRESSISEEQSAK